MKINSMVIIKSFLYSFLLSITFITGKICYGQGVDTPAINVRIITDEADAVLSILHKKEAGKTITDSDWQSLFSSEGYIRLKKREAAMQRPFTDEDFKSFILSGQLDSHIAALERTLQDWKQADVISVARLPLAYLPDNSKIHAKIYPVIKPKKNSFVFDVDTDPAIFLFIDTTKSEKQFENTMAHELHHIGFAENCKDTNSSGDSSAVKTVLSWVSAFGEGFAMLAAAGGPDIHPHKYSNAEDRARWDKDVANFNDDLKKVDDFLSDILENKLSKNKIDETGYSFFGIQGPWYTVGWKMSVTIEKVYGRKKLIECMCNQKLLLSTYNKAALEYNKSTGGNLALWSPALIDGTSE